MTPAARERQQVRIPLLAASAIAWIALLARAAPPGNDMTDPSMTGMAPGTEPGVLIASGALMVVAMMVPLLGPPTRHVLAASLARRRTRSAAEFLVGYLAPWILVGAILMVVPGVLGTNPSTTAVAVAITAVVWQVSPTKQRCLNRLHAHPTLPAFGSAADLGALRYGLSHAGWCIGACWSLMLLAVVVPGWSLLAMALVTLWLAAERLERPERPGWRLRVPVKGVRLVLAHTRLVCRPGSLSRQWRRAYPALHR